MASDPDSRKTVDLPASIGDLARLRAEVQDLRAELGAAREQLEHLAELVERGSGTTVIGGRRARVVVEIVGD